MNTSNISQFITKCIGYCNRHLYLESFSRSVFGKISWSTYTALGQYHTIKRPSWNAANIFVLSFHAIVVIIVPAKNTNLKLQEQWTINWKISGKYSKTLSLFKSDLLFQLDWFKKQLFSYLLICTDAGNQREAFHFFGMVQQGNVFPFLQRTPIIPSIFAKIYVDLLQESS